MGAQDAAEITADWLTGRHFTFHAGAKLLASSLCFERNGRIAGYAHPNEAGWLIERGMLVILRADGVPTCLALPHVLPSGVVALSGPFLLGDVGHTHCFTEIPDPGDDRQLCSFDLFDTLVARRCKEPLAIFALVEQASGVAGFARARRQAELRLARVGDYSFDDIFNALAEDTGWSRMHCAALQQCELATEWDQLFPIREMVARVGPHDLIVSDMYLPMAFIRRLVEEKCGLPGRPIHLSNSGKHRGTIWPEIARTARILRHHGDNPHGDIRSAQAAGLQAELVTVSDWSRGERILLKAGLPHFAHAIREARLSSFAADLRLRRAQLAQLEVNLPMLILAGIAALERARARNVDTLLMCARDCNLWVELMEWMVPRAVHQPDVRYFTTSRILMLGDDADYAAYFDSIRGTRTMLVDVSGTGRSPAHFLARLGRAADSSIFIAFASRHVAGFIDALTTPHDEIDLDILTEQRLLVRLCFECLNMSLDERSMRIVRVGEEFDFIREPNEFGPLARLFIATMRDAFRDAMGVLRASGITSVPGSIDPVVLKTALAELVALIESFRDVLLPIMRDVSDQEPHIAAAAFAARAQSETQRVETILS